MDNSQSITQQKFTLLHFISLATLVAMILLMEVITGGLLIEIVTDLASGTISLFKTSLNWLTSLSIPPF